MSDNNNRQNGKPRPSPRPQRSAGTPKSSAASKSGNSSGRASSAVGNGNSNPQPVQPSRQGSTAPKQSAASRASKGAKAAGLSVRSVPRGAAHPTVHLRATGAASAGAAPSIQDPGKLDQAWERLEYHSNPYYATLADPFNVGGVRIPDSVNYPSATFSIVKRVGLQSSTAGVAACAIGWYARSGLTNNLARLVPVKADANSADQWILGEYNTSQASLTDLFGTGITGLVPGDYSVKLDQWQSGALTVPGLFSQVRLVSAGIAVNSAASLTTLQGVWRGAFAPPGFYNDRNNATLPNNVTWDQLGALTNSVEEVINKGRGVTVTYSPLDLSALDYIDINAPVGTASKVDFADLGCLIIAANGLAVNTSLTVTITLNYEGIPLANAMNFLSAKAGIDDPLMLASAMNKRDDDEWVHAGTNEAAKTEHISHPLHVDYEKGDSEKILHHKANLQLVRKKSGGSGRGMEVVEREQEGFLEHMFKAIIPTIDGAVDKLLHLV